MCKKSEKNKLKNEIKTNKKFGNPNLRYTHSGPLESLYEIWYPYVVPFSHNSAQSHTDTHTVLLYVGGINLKVNSLLGKSIFY